MIQKISLGASKTFALSVGFVIIDQLFKYLAISRHVCGSEALRGAFQLHENAGIAFGLFPSWGFLIAGFSFLSAVVFLVKKFDGSQLQDKPAIAYLLVAAASNVADRLIRRHVVDYLILYYGSRSLFFNLADVMIVCMTFRLIKGKLRDLL